MKENYLKIETSRNKGQITLTHTVLGTLELNVEHLALVVISRYTFCLINPSTKWKALGT